MADEPTSALDHETALLVERALRAIPGMARVWVSHDPQQPARVGGTILNMRARPLTGDAASCASSETIVATNDAAVVSLNASSSNDDRVPLRVSAAVIGGKKVSTPAHVLFNVCCAAAAVGAGDFAAHVAAIRLARL